MRRFTTTSATAAVGLLLAIGVVQLLQGAPFLYETGVVPNNPNCIDTNAKCAIWAERGECHSNPAWMMQNCARSCQTCQGNENAWQLRDKLAEQYRKMSAKKNHTINTVEVKSVELINVETNEAQQIVEIYGRIILSWNDSRVTWDKKEWNISWLNFYWLQIWTPQLMQTNAPATKEAEIKSKVLGANSAGNVFMWLDFSLSVMTEFDYSRFPFDRQRGCFKVDDKRHFAVHLKIDSNAREFARNSIEALHPARWDVEDIELLENQFSIKVLQNDVPMDALSSNLDICVTIKRDTSYVGLAVVGPCVATALITMMSFFATTYWNQILILIASIGLQIISAHSFVSELPPAAGVVPPFVKFCAFNMAVTCLLLIIISFLSFLTSLKNAFPPPSWISKPISYVCTFCPFFDKQSDQVKLGEDGAALPPNDSSSGPWNSVAKAIKIFCMIATFSLYILVLLISFSG